VICLDTNVVIDFLRGRQPALVARLEREIAPGVFAIPAIVLFELRYGVEKSPYRERNEHSLLLFRQLPIAVLPFEEEDADVAGEIRADLERSGRPIGPYDLLIAAQARRRDALLITANTREFDRVRGLRVEDWSV
jgi:tRNA(fMet)-specific endonuclease VapC